MTASVFLTGALPGRRGSVQAGDQGFQSAGVESGQGE